MTFRFDFRFIAPKKGDLPFPPKWYIYVKNSHTDDDGFPAITPLDCVEPDIDEEVNRLIKELETLREKAKKKFLDYSE